MLKKPARNFGFLPSGDFTGHVVFAVLFLFLPLCFVLWRLVTGGTMTNNEYFMAGFRSFLLLLYGWFLVQNMKNMNVLLARSRRKRYLRSHLIPFLKKRYGITLAADIENLEGMIVGNPLKTNKNKVPEPGIYLFGWTSIEAAARGERLEYPPGAKTQKRNPPLSEVIYLMHLEDEHTMVELPRKDDPEHEPIRLEWQEEPLSVEETERQLRNMITTIIGKLPAGKTHFQCIAPDNDEEDGDGWSAGVSARFLVTVDSHGDVLYSEKELKSFVESALFNLRMQDECMFLLFCDADSGKRYVAGRMMANGNSYYTIKGAQIREFLSMRGMDVDDIHGVDQFEEMV